MTQLRRTTPASVEAARRVLARERAALRALGVPGELVLTGGSSLPGLLTKGDIDLHLRVDAEGFRVAVARLPEHMAAVHPGIWTDSFATFEREAGGAVAAVGIAVTVVGSPHDRRFTVSWERLAGDPALRDEYDALKSAPDAETAKSAFFDRIAADDWQG